MPTVGEILFNFVLPAIIVAAGLWLFKGRWIGAIAVTAAFAVADCGISGKPHWPPGTGDASLWLIWFTIPVGVLGLLDALCKPPDWLRALLLWALAHLAMELLLAPLTSHASTADIWSMTLWTDALSLAVVLWWLAMEHQSHEPAGPLFPLSLLLTCAGAAAIFGLGNDIKPSQASVALAGMAVVIGVLRWLHGCALERGLALAFAMPLFGLYALAHFYYYTEPPVTSAVLLALAPLTALACTRRRWFVRLIPVILLVAVAVGLSLHQYLKSEAAQPASAQQEDY